MKLGEPGQPGWLMCGVGRIDGPIARLIARAYRNCAADGIIPSLTAGHVQQDFAHFLEHLSEEAVDRLQVDRTQGPNQADPELAHDTIQIVT
jgi:hypothetical protein